MAVVHDTSVIPGFQSVLNNIPLVRLGNRCPLTAFTGLPQDTPLLSIKTGIQKNILIKSMDEVRVLQLINAQRLHEALNDIHRDAASRSSKSVRNKSYVIAAALAFVR